jgi:predicted TIM-barrel fold metal-dependent hydrolase
LEIDTLGISVAVLSQIGAATPGLTIVMDHFAGKPTTFDVEDSWKADMLTAASYVGLNIKVSEVHKLSSQVVTGQPAGLKQFQPVAAASRYVPTLEFLWRTFGEDRLIFGTNWPVSDAGGLFVDSIDWRLTSWKVFWRRSMPTAGTKPCTKTRCGSMAVANSHRSRSLIYQRSLPRRRR